METKKYNLPIVIVVLVVAVAMVVAVVVGAITLNKNLKAVLEPIKASQHFNTSSLEEWGGNFSEGNITMVGAEVYAYNEADNKTVFLDQNGEMWTVEGECDSNEFYLLWIADNLTPEVNDDVVIKVWSEVHN